MKIADTKRRKLSLFSIFFTFFVDNLGWSIVFPIFAPFFMDVNNQMFTQEISTATRTSLLGLFLFAFPFAQFFGAPILGEFADRAGRKKALILSVFLTMVGYLLSAWSIHHKMLGILFFSRLLTGLFAGNLSICLAATTDLCETEKIKRKIFGYLSAVAGFSFIIGAFIGGKFSDPTISPLFNHAFPFWIATGITFLNLLFVIFAFYETKETNAHEEFDLWEGIHNIKQALKVKNIKSLYLIYFLFVFSWSMVLQFTPVLVIDRFQFGASKIGDIAAFMGICWAFGSTVLQKLIIKKISPLKTMEICLFIFTLVCLIIIFPVRVEGLFVVLGIGVVFAGVCWPICTALISSHAEKKMQGKILGISQSMLSLAMALSPLIGGLGDHIFWGFPFVFAALTSLLATLLYFTLKLK